VPRYICYVCLHGLVPVSVVCHAEGVVSKSRYCGLRVEVEARSIEEALEKAERLGA